LQADEHRVSVSGALTIAVEWQKSSVPKMTRRPPLLPARRAALHGLRSSVLAVLSADHRRSCRLVPRSIDTREIDSAWPSVSPSPSCFEDLAGMVRRAQTGRARPEQANKRAIVSKTMDQMGIRDLRLGDVRFHLGPDRYVPTGDGHDVRTGALRITLTAPLSRGSAKAETLGANFRHVQESLREAGTGGRPVAILADYRRRHDGQAAS
jgi:hypothetical protein